MCAVCCESGDRGPNSGSGGAGEGRKERAACPQQPAGEP